MTTERQRDQQYIENERAENLRRARATTRVTAERSRLDEAVSVAMATRPDEAALENIGDLLGEMSHRPDEWMRAALLASLPVFLVPLASEFRADAARLYESAGRADKRSRAGFAPSIDGDELRLLAQEAEANADRLESLYAPSLGEGDGR